MGFPINRGIINMSETDSNIPLDPNVNIARGSGLTTTSEGT